MGAAGRTRTTRHAAEDRGAAVAGGIRRAQRRENADDDVATQAEVSENPVGNTPVRVLYPDARQNPPAAPQWKGSALKPCLKRRICQSLGVGATVNRN